MSKNPAKSQPLSTNVRRLMTMARESPQNPNVQKFNRLFNERDQAYCCMQAGIFMAAVDRDIPLETFAPLYMTSQLAGVMDHSFSCTGNMDDDHLSQILRIPLLLKSPETIVDVTVWLSSVAGKIAPSDSAALAIATAINDNSYQPEPISPKANTLSLEELTDLYEYAYWLGYIYRYECLLHDESSRMVYGAFNEAFMHKTYDELNRNGLKDLSLHTCAGDICSNLDQLLIGKLWK